MELPKYESKHLARSPLVSVAAQINFEEVGRDVTHAQAREVQKILGSFWTKLQAAPQIRTTFTPTGAVNEPNRQAYRLLSSDEKWAVVVNPDSVIIETQHYLGWEDMSLKVVQMAQAIAQVLDPAQALRLGLRYVDQVPLPDGRDSWDGLIPAPLLSISTDPMFAGSVLASDQRHLLQIDEDKRCMLRHGLLDDPSGRHGGIYLLDYDVFGEAPAPYNAKTIAAAADILHGYAGSLFRLSVTDELYEWLGG